MQDFDFTQTNLITFALISPVQPNLPKSAETILLRCAAASPAPTTLILGKDETISSIRFQLKWKQFKEQHLLSLSFLKFVVWDLK